MKSASKRRAWPVLGSALVVGFLLLLLWGGGDWTGLSGASDTARAPARTTPPAALEEVRPGSGRDQLSPPEPGGVVAADPSSPAVVFFGGHVMDGLDGRPVPAAEVSFALPGVAPEHARTDAAGDFELALDPEVWRVGRTCRVAIAGDGGRRLLGSIVALREQLTFVVPSPFTLRGRVECPGPGSAGPRVVGVRALAQGPGTSTPVFRGRAEVHPDGEFVIPLLAYRDSLPSEFILQFTLVGSERETGEVPRHGVSREALLSEGGARVCLDWHSLVCRVLDSSGTPIEGAQVACGPPGGWEVARASTDEEGRAALLLPVGATEICVGAPGYASTRDRIAATANGREHRVYELEPLDDRDEIRGVVLFEDGEPVDDAFVSAHPACENAEIEMAGLVSTRSDSRGAFRLRSSSGSGGAVRMQAYHRGSGMSDQLHFVPDGREVRLTIERQGTALVEFEFLDEPSLVRSSAVHYVLVGTDDDRSMAGQTSGTSARIEEVPPGRYDIYLFASGMDAYGEGALEVVGGEVTHCVVGMRAASWIEGRVVGLGDRAIAGVRVEVGDGGWPRDVVESLGWAVTDAEGRFRLLAGRRREVGVRVGAEELLVLCRGGGPNVLEVGREDPGE